MLGNRGGLLPKIDTTYVWNACILLKGPQFSTLYSGGSCAICTGPSSINNWLSKHNLNAMAFKFGTHELVVLYHFRIMHVDVIIQSSDGCAIVSNGKSQSLSVHYSSSC